MLLCSHIAVNITEVTVVQVRGLASYKTRFNPPFSNVCTKNKTKFQKHWTPGKIQNECQVRNMTVVIHLFWCVWSFDFDIWLSTFRFEFSSGFSIFVILLFSYSKVAPILSRIWYEDIYIVIDHLTLIPIYVFCLNVIFSWCVY